MSIFTSRVGATPNRVEMLIEFLKNNTKSLTKKDLKEMFSPKDSSTAFNDVFGFCQLFKILTIENDIVILKSKKKKSNYEIIKEAIFNCDLSIDDSFLEILSWILSQNKDKLIGGSDNVGDIIKNDLNNTISELISAQPWQNFIYWAEYLGFVTKLPIGNNLYILPDPTEAIRKEFSNLFKKKESYPIKEFITNISVLLSVLEFGYYREKISKSLRDGLQLSENTLSYSTSLALKRLEKINILEFILKSDANVIILEDGTNNHRISHIKYLGQ